MSDLPSGWSFAEIEEVILEQRDGKRIHQGWSPQCEKEPCTSPDEWGVLKTTSIQAGEFQWQHHKKLPAHLEARTSIEVSVGDLLLTCAGPRVRCGVACLVRNTRPKLLLSGKMYRFRAVPGATDERYLEAFLQTQEAQLQIDAMKTGGSDSGLNLTHERFKKLRVHLAPYQEQTRIVAKLEELLSDLDASVAELKAAQKKLAQYRQSLLKAAVEGALTAEWRAKNTPTETGAELLERILQERRARWEAKQLAKFKEQGKAPPKGWQAKYPEPVQPDTADLPALPQGWVWASLDQCSLDESAITDGPFGSNLKSSHYQDFGPRVIRLQNIGDGFFVDARASISESHYSELLKHAVQTDDLVVAMLGEVLPRACIIPHGVAPAIVKADCARVRINKDLIKPSIVMAQLNSKPVREAVAKFVKGIGRPRVNLGHVRAIPIALCSMEEQLQVEALLSYAQQSIDQQNQAIELALKQATSQRQNLLRAAFSGQLVPQDPNDEPASVLLERIRAERAARDAVKKPRGRKPKEPA